MNSNYFDKSFHLNELGFSVYLEKPLNSNLDDVTSHMNNCKKCYQEYLVWKDFLESHQYIAIKNRKLPYTLSSAAVLLCFLLYWFFISHFEAERFIPHKIYEPLLSQTFRAQNVQLISPKIGEVFTEGFVTFKWESDFNDVVWIVLLNNLAEELERIKVDGHTFTLNKELRSGLYYWKLETKDDLLFLGKFLIH